MAAQVGTTSHPPVRRRVLVVEDDADSREMLRMLLEMEGHDVQEAEDGPGALAAVAAMGPDVALIDVGLPGLDGHEVARRLRAERTDPAILLVALTGYAAPEDRERSRAAGFDVHLTKPITPEKLDEILRMLRAPRPLA
jgi:CheY-like chemotaxis protein